MKLNAPDVNCQQCKGTGARARDLQLVVDGQPLNLPTKVLLHCGCLSPELKKLHSGLDTDGILHSWPWDELKNLETPKASDGSEPVRVGCPFPISVEAAPIPVAEKPDAKPQQVTPDPEPKVEMPKKKVKKKKHP